MCPNNIRKLRHIKKISLDQLAIDTGLSMSYIAHLEIGSRSNPSYNSMVKICRALNEDMESVFPALKTDI